MSIENIMIPIAPKGTKPGSIRPFDILSHSMEPNPIPMENILNNNGSSLSGGERRRVEIARALAIEPKFLLLDEPFAGIDPISIIEIQKIIKELVNANIGVLITDHNVRETLGIVDKASILFDGSVIMSGRPEEIKADERVREVYLGNNF